MTCQADVLKPNVFFYVWVVVAVYCNFSMEINEALHLSPHVEPSADGEPDEWSVQYESTSKV